MNTWLSYQKISSLLAILGCAGLLALAHVHPAYAVDGDIDDDGILDGVDNCPDVANPGQDDGDFDGIGDLCDTVEGNCGNFFDDDNDGFFDCGDPDCFTDPFCIDTDGDFWPDIIDNCPAVANGMQEDSDFNGIGDACQDGDADGALDTVDNCLDVVNPDQADTDLDLIGNACDPTESRCNNGTDDDEDDLIDCDDPDCATAQVCLPPPDSDNDGVSNATDNCPDDANSDQADNDGDGAGNACDSSPDGPTDTGGDSNIASGDVGGGGCALTSNAAEAPGTLLFLTLLGTSSLVWRIRRQR